MRHPSAVDQHLPSAASTAADGQKTARTLVSHTTPWHNIKTVVIDSGIIVSGNEVIELEKGNLPRQDSGFEHDHTWIS